MTKTDTADTVVSESLPVRARNHDNAYGTEGLWLTLFVFAAGLATILHGFQFDRPYAIENALVVLGITVGGAWRSRPNMLVLPVVLMQAIWSIADFLHGAPSWICLSGGATRTAISVLLIVWIARIRRRLDRADQAARVDSLTGLPNRRAILEALDAEFCRTRRSGRSFSLALLDCDGFKSINDQQGHLAGDQVLQKIAAALRKQTRAYDCIGRFGGDEFVMILSEADAEEVTAVIERIRTSLKLELLRDYPSLSFSIGVVTMTPSMVGQHSSVTWEDCLRMADAAMYAAKRSGPDETHFDRLEIGQQ